jgi:hypothetical protein
MLFLQGRTNVRFTESGRSTDGPAVYSMAILRRAQVLTEKRNHMILEAIGNGTGVLSVIHLKAVLYTVIIEDLALYSAPS